MLVEGERPLVGIPLAIQAEHVLDLALIQCGCGQKKRNAGKAGGDAESPCSTLAGDDDEEVLSAAYVKRIPQDEGPGDASLVGANYGSELPFELVADIKAKLRHVLLATSVGVDRSSSWCGPRRVSCRTSQGASIRDGRPPNARSRLRHSSLRGRSLSKMDCVTDEGLEEAGDVEAEDDHQGHEDCHREDCQLPSAIFSRPRVCRDGPALAPLGFRTPSARGAARTPRIPPGAKS